MEKEVQLILASVTALIAISKEARQWYMAIKKKPEKIKPTKQK